MREISTLEQELRRQVTQIRNQETLISTMEIEADNLKIQNQSKIKMLE